MAFFVWQNNFTFGIESIDGDHKKLVAMIDELYTAMSKGEAKAVIRDIVNDLVDYSVVHFRREEIYMKSVNYNDFDAHKAAHEAFIEKVETFREKLNSGKDNISIEVISFLREWLSGHILNTDKRFVPEFKKCGIN